jgi:release factor glutamine methyltransferase
VSTPTSSASNELWTTRRLLAWMQETFARKQLDAPRKQAEMLLEHVLGCKQLDLYTNPDRPASPLERDTLRNLVTRALKQEPIQYLVGKERFFGIEFHVDKRVLIPRPETQTIVEEVLQNLRARHGQAATKGEGVLIADVCAGSGCIGIALLKNLPGARVVATELSADAVEVAHGNAVRVGVSDRLDLLTGDLLQPLLEHPATRGTGALDYLVSNPPYIPDDEWAAVEPNVKDYEPHLALRGGVDGLDYVRRLLADGPRLVKAGGLMLVEIAESRAGEALALFRGHAELSDARLLKDFLGKPRVVVGIKRG